MDRQIAALAAHPLAAQITVSQIGYGQLPGAPAGPHRRFGVLLGNARAQFEIDSQKGIPVLRVLGQMDNVGHIPQNPVGEKAAIHLTAPIRQSLPFQPVNKGQGAVVVPIQHRRIRRQFRRQLQQRRILAVPVGHGDSLENGPAVPDRRHILFPAAFVLGNKPVGYPD